MAVQITTDPEQESRGARYVGSVVKGHVAQFVKLWGAKLELTKK